MIDDPAARGRAIAAFHASTAPRLFEQIVEADAVPIATRAQAWREWEVFTLYACVRGLVSAGGFNRETAAAIDAMHEAVLEGWMAAPATEETFDARRARIAERYAEYGGIGQAGGASGATTVADRLGAAASRHMSAPAEPLPGLDEMASALHEALADGAAEAVRHGAAS
ncbi:MAG: hypothetical protein HOP12_09250 [Candidatus Eisenbacteria bacterium]|uniref:Uncharacterized protein n=1 Tax=Eiseniibacteriota bacterium TaxID=2212470 RepID=A0A849SIT6_UNCEI|nr:hypothetical protein [Candidatus Eisenbacteria bacterium]